MSDIQQRLVVYTDAAGEPEVYTSVYGDDESETQHLIEQCKVRHPDAKDIRVLDTNVAWPKERLKP